MKRATYKTVPSIMVQPTDRDVALSFFDYLYETMALNNDYRDNGALSSSAMVSHCQFTPDIIYLERNQRLFGIGDIHGDFDFLFLTLQTARLINYLGEWTGGNSVVIQLGDMLDSQRSMGGVVPTSGNHESKILNFLKNLHLQALRSGGMVVTMLGNHDLGRLFIRYNELGQAVLPSAENGYFLKLGDRYDLGLDTSLPTHENGMTLGYAHRISGFMSAENQNDFDKGQSLQNLININEYNKDEYGHHRQLLASCATKCLIKFCWRDDPTLGGLASHGEKHGNYIKSFFSQLIKDFTTLHEIYQFDLPNFEKLLSDRDSHVILLNALVSFSLRYYRLMEANPQTDHFATLVYYTLKKLSDYRHESFIWCYLTPDSTFDSINSKYNPPKQFFTKICQQNSIAQEYFRLDSTRSINLSAHSGPYGNGRILANERAVCYDHNWRLRTRRTDRTSADMKYHNNTVIMTDVMGSRGFGYNTFRGIDRAPQVIDLSLQGHSIVAKVHHINEAIIDEKTNYDIKETEELLKNNDSPATSSWMREKTSSYGDYRPRQIHFTNNYDNINRNFRRMLKPSKPSYLDLFRGQPMVESETEPESDSSMISFSTDSESYISSTDDTLSSLNMTPTLTSHSMQDLDELDSDDIFTLPRYQTRSPLTTRSSLSSPELQPLPDVPLEQLTALRPLWK